MRKEEAADDFTGRKRLFPTKQFIICMNMRLLLHSFPTHNPCLNSLAGVSSLSIFQTVTGILSSKHPEADRVPVST